MSFRARRLRFPWMGASGTGVLHTIRDRGPGKSFGQRSSLPIPSAIAGLLANLNPPDGRVVGHLLFSPVQIDGCGFDPPIMVGLAPVGVLPEYQGRGIGSRLIREGFDACREAGYGAAVVLGEPGYYSRFGFERASGKGLGNEYGVDEYFMVVELSNGTLDSVSGTVRYREEFREISA